MTNLVFLDTETTGVGPDREVWDVGIIRRAPDGGEVWTQFFMPIDLSRADPFALDIGRFYQRHPVGQHFSRRFIDDSEVPLTTYSESPPRGSYVSQSAGARNIARMTHGAHVVGAVPNFDTEVLDRLLRANGCAPKWHYHLVDVENLMVGWLAANGNPLAPPWKSSDLSEAIGVPMPDESERHTALGDAVWAMRIYDKILGAAS